MTRVVVPIHGARWITERFLEYWRWQHFPAQLEFHDDHSPDDSVPWLREHGHLVRTYDERPYFNGILRTAIAEWDGREPLAILNNDIHFREGFVGKMSNTTARLGAAIVVPQTAGAEDRCRGDECIEQQGWAMWLGPRAKEIPPIPEDLRLWYGDTWLFRHAWDLGLGARVATHVHIRHDVEGTTRYYGESTRAIIAEDNRVVREKYPHLLNGKRDA